MVSIGLVANVYQEANALPGWLETHLPLFDDVRVLHSGPQGSYSTDGTIELLERWRVPVEFGSIDDGFGAVRSRAVRMSPCEWVVLLDADERLFPVHRVLTCSGRSTPPAEVDEVLRGYGPDPDWERIGTLGSGLRVGVGAPYDQEARLRELISCNPHLDAVASVRRHWHDLSFKRPTQNWFSEPDWQLRVVRNADTVYFDPGTRMHERLLGAKNILHADLERGPMFDHMHFWFKRMEMEQRAHDVAIYDKLHAGEKPPTLKEFSG